MLQKQNLDSHCFEIVINMILCFLPSFHKPLIGAATIFEQPLKLKNPRFLVGSAITGME
jgi:hypothetical protein